MNEIVSKEKKFLMYYFSSSLFMCMVYVHVCVYLYLYVCVFISAGTHVCLGMCVWKPETDVTNHLESLVHIVH